MSPETKAIVVPIVAAVLGEMASAQLFVQGWIAACDLGIAMIALLRGRLRGGKLFAAIMASLVTGVACSLGIRIVYWVVFDLFGVQKNAAAGVTYWAVAANFAVFFAGRAL